MSAIYGSYTVVKGDTLSKISKKYNISVSKLISINKSKYPSLVKNKNLIRVGWVLQVPSVGNGGSTTPTATNPTTISVNWSRNLKVTHPMMRGEDVKAVQEQLQKLGISPGKIDGIYGPKTEAAVKAFQKKAGLTVDGIVGKKTWAALFGNRSSSSIIKSTIKDSVIMPTITPPPPIKKVPASISAYDPADIGAVCYIIQMHTGLWCPLPTVPTEVRCSASANWEDVSVLGRSSQYVSYGGTRSRNYSFSMQLHADMLWTRSGEYNNSGETDLLPVINFLQGLVYPQYASNLIKPPVCRIRIADSYNIRGVVKNVDVTKKLPIRKMSRGIKEGKKIYTNYEVSLSIQEVPIVPYTATEINQRGDY